MLNDLGVLRDSIRFFHEPDDFTLHNLYYSPRAGIYHCDDSYQFARNASTISTCQLILVDNGELSMNYDGDSFLLTEGMFTLMQLKTPHLYRTNGSQVKMRWFHLDGGAVSAYVDLITGMYGTCLSLRQYPGLHSEIDKLFSLFARKDADPHEMSVFLHNLLALLARPTQKKPGTSMEHAIEESLTFMKANFTDPELSLDQIAAHAALSTSYYLKQFKKQENITPHQYLKKLRIAKASELLDTTSRSIEDIGISCGFCSASHFISVFKEQTGLTPLQFRSLWR